MAEARIGLMGGSFDPVHLGHLIAAQDALEGLDLDQVVLIPAARSPLKNQVPDAGDEDRLAMLEAAVAGDDRLSLSTLELERGGVSYTVDTVAKMVEANPGAGFFWIIGADQALSLHAWHKVDELAGMVEFVVLARPGYSGIPDEAPAGARIHQVESHPFSISSSEIRNRCRQGKPVRFFVPEGVASLIETRHLYR